MDIAGKVFIVTGGASGLGEGTAKALAARGDAWRPWRSLAALTLWRVADADTGVAAPTPRSQD